MRVDTIEKGMVLKMADRERFDVEYEGEQASIFRDFGGHRFTDGECEAFRRGDVVMFKAEKKAGGFYTAVMKLGRNDRGYIGTILDFDLDPNYAESAFWCGYTFDEDECRRLLDGEVVQGHFTWKSGKESDCGCEFVDENGNGVRRFKPVFDN